MLKNYKTYLFVIISSFLLASQASDKKEKPRRSSLTAPQTRKIFIYYFLFDHN